tara:strand:+ start:211 stop:471 length:261 start_codon:yes stop_codon:yes gene_type:complete
LLRLSATSLPPITIAAAAPTDKTVLTIENSLLAGSSLSYHPCVVEQELIKKIVIRVKYLIASVYPQTIKETNIFTGFSVIPTGLLD